jgi:hypothetical protein
VFLGHNNITKDWNLVHLEASTKPHVHQKFEIFWTNIASTMAWPMSKNGPKKGLRPLGVNLALHWHLCVWLLQVYGSSQCGTVFS